MEPASSGKSLGSTKGISSPFTAVVGATGGIGFAAASALADESHSLLLTGRNARKLADNEARLRARHPDADIVTVVGDMTSRDFSYQVLGALPPGCELANVIVAAGLDPAPGVDGRRIWAVNCEATRRLLEDLLPRISRGGAAVIVASMSANFLGHGVVDRAARAWSLGRPSLLRWLLLRGDNGTAYAFSKRANQVYVRTRAPLFAQRGVRLVSVSPGMIHTEMGDSYDNLGSIKKILQSTPTRRMGKPEECGDLLCFLVSEKGRYISGTDILVDGGYMAGVGWKEIWSMVKERMASGE